MATIINFPERKFPPPPKVGKFGVAYCDDYPSPAPHCMNNKLQRCPMALACPVVRDSQ